MQDFLDDLDRRLADLAEPAREPHRGRRRAGLLGGVTAVLAAAAAAFTMTGTSIADLPILDTETRDAASLATTARSAAEAGVDFSQAHVFRTPAGPGYALVNEATQTMCLVIPDPLAPGSVGQACDSPISKVERRGMFAEVVGDRDTDPDATSLVAFVLPEDAEDVRLRIGGRAVQPTIESGVVVAELPREATLSWTVDGRRAERRLEGPFQKTTAVGFQCPDGRQVTAPVPPTGATLERTNELLREARKRACD